MCFNVNTLFTLIQKYSQPVEKDKVNRTDAPLYEEVKRLKKEVTRLTQERGILKKSAAYFAN
jgi:transposase